MINMVIKMKHKQITLRIETFIAKDKQRVRGYNLTVFNLKHSL